MYVNDAHGLCLERSCALRLCDAIALFSISARSMSQTFRETVGFY